MDVRKLMREMKTRNIDAKRVTIETASGTLVIENPQVVRMEVMGKSSFQIVGEEREEKGLSEEDVKMVAESAGVSEDAAKKALNGSGGDIAKAILGLKEKKEGVSR